MSKAPFTLQELKAVICELMNLNNKTELSATINRQISRFVLNDNMTYKEIGRCIYYYVKVRNKQIDPLYGIGFVSALRQEAALYWAKRDTKEEERKEAAKKFENTGEEIRFNISEIIKNQKTPYQLQPIAFEIDEEENDDRHK